MMILIKTFFYYNFIVKYFIFKLSAFIIIIFRILFLSFNHLKQYFFTLITPNFLLFLTSLFKVY